MDAEEVAPGLRPQASAPPRSELDMPHVVVLGSYHPEQEENPVLALVPLQEPAIQGSGAAGGGGGARGGGGGGAGAAGGDDAQGAERGAAGRTLLACFLGGAVTAVALITVYFTKGCGSIDCGDHGRCVDPECASCVGVLADPECACSDDAYGPICSLPLNNWTVPAACVAGMGSHGVVYNGTAYRTLDDAPPEGGSYGAPNDGCQRICTQYYEYSNGNCRTRGEPNYLPLPPGYALAPPDADTLAVIVAHSWSTHCVVTADGNGYTWSREMPWSPRLPTRCADNKLNSSSSGAGGEYTATQESSRVLVRCR